MSKAPVMHCIRFDDRALGMALEPDGTGSADNSAAHALSLAFAVTEIAAAAREVAERLDPGGDPAAARHLHGLLIGVEALGSILEGLAIDIGDELKERSA